MYGGRVNRKERERVTNMDEVRETDGEREGGGEEEREKRETRVDVG